MKQKEKHAGIMACRSSLNGNKEVSFCSIEQDHRFIKKKVRSSLGYRSSDTAERTLQGVEAMRMIRKGQLKRIGRDDAQGQAKFVANLFQVAA